MRQNTGDEFCFFSFSSFFFFLLTECKEPVRCHGMRFVGVPGGKKSRFAGEKKGKTREVLTVLRWPRGWREAKEKAQKCGGKEVARERKPWTGFLTAADALEIYVYCCLWNETFAASYREPASISREREKWRRSRTGRFCRLIFVKISPSIGTCIEFFRLQAGRLG